MGFLPFSIFFFLILMPLVLGIILPIYKKHKEVSDGIINYDSTMRKFVYKVNYPSEEILNLLVTKNDADELTCEINFEKAILKFSEYGSSREYYYNIQECNGFSIIRFEQVALIGMSSHVPYKLNPFMVQKLQAEIIPYSQYGA